jgi:hypothetical protein
MDGSDLRVTHYCGAKNQPRMKAVSYDSTAGILRFDFVDVTNVAKPGAYYTSEIQVTFLDENHAEIRFNGRDQGVERPSTVTLAG